MYESDKMFYNFKNLMEKTMSIISVSDLWENWLKKTESDIIPITICDGETTVVFELEGKEFRLNKTHEGGWLLEATSSESV